MILSVYLSSCQQNSSPKASETTNSISVDQSDNNSNASPADEKQSKTTGKIASATEILARPQVPILCYHQVRPIHRCYT